MKISSIIIITMFIVDIGFSLEFIGCEVNKNASGPVTICTFDNILPSRTIDPGRKVTFCFQPKPPFKSVTIFITNDYNISIEDFTKTLNIVHQVSLIVTRKNLDYYFFSCIHNGVEISEKELSFKKIEGRVPVFTFLGKWKGSRNFITTNLELSTNCKNFTTNSASNDSKVEGRSLSYPDSIAVNPKNENIETDYSSWYIIGCVLFTVLGASSILAILLYMKKKKNQEKAVKIDLSKEMLQIDLQDTKNSEETNSYVNFQSIDESTDQRHFDEEPEVLYTRVKIGGPRKYRNTEVTKEPDVIYASIIPEVFITQDNGQTEQVIYANIDKNVASSITMYDNVNMNGICE